MVTHSSPLLILKHLHSASTVVKAVHQSETSGLGDERICKHPRELYIPSNGYRFSPMLILSELSSWSLFQPPKCMEEVGTGGLLTATPNPSHGLHCSYTAQDPRPISCKKILVAFTSFAPNISVFLLLELVSLGSLWGETGFPAGIPPTILNKHFRRDLFHSPAIGQVQENHTDC